MRRLLPVRVLVFTVLCLTPLPLWAMPAIDCHCFTDRSYDPGHPTLADPYFLATTQNSFFAAFFGIDKKTIVLKKQRGIGSDDLWVAYGIASRTGRDPEALLDAKDGGTWESALVSQRVDTASLGRPFATLLRNRGADAALGREVVNEMLERYRLIGTKELAAVRAEGASNQELLLAVFLAERTHRPVRVIWDEVKTGRRSWGAELVGAGIAPSDIQEGIVALLAGRSR